MWGGEKCPFIVVMKNGICFLIDSKVKKGKINAFVPQIRLPVEKKIKKDENKATFDLVLLSFVIAIKTQSKTNSHV